MTGIWEAIKGFFAAIPLIADFFKFIYKSYKKIKDSDRRNDLDEKKAKRAEILKLLEQAETDEERAKLLERLNNLDD